MRSVVFLIALTVPNAIGCGGKTQSITIPQSDTDFPPTSAGAVPYDPRIGELRDVPGGLARIGAWTFTPGSLAATAQPCSPSAAPPSILDFNGEVVVASFRLMTTEVSNQAYSLCVDSAACLEPDLPTPTTTGVDWRASEIANHPVSVTWSLARAFCQHYGGDLPTAGEYARAVAGDAEGYGAAGVLEVWRACVRGVGDPQECAHLFLGDPHAALIQLSDVGQDPIDVGVYGHHDLFANAYEWQRATYDYGKTSWCATPDEHDITILDPSTNRPLTYYPVGFLSGLVEHWVNTGASDVQPVSPDISIALPINTASSVPPLGFRCAFPLNQ